ncbi:MAG: mechanosensitive ion channel domain-containing protein [Thermoplasmata archaeon]
MEHGNRKLMNYILWEFAIFLVLVFSILYLNMFLQFGAIQEAIIELLPKTIGVILLVVITKLVLGLLRPAFDKAFEKRLPSHTDVMMTWQFLANIVWIFVIILIILVMMGNFEAFFGFGVIVAAALWVLQGPILNLAGWLVIIFHRLYTIGDRIEIAGTKGYVVDIGMFHTTLREFGEWMKGDTFTGRLTSVPNSNVFETPILNYTKDTPYIWDEVKIAITYESDHSLAKQIILDSAFEVVGDNMKRYSKLMEQKMDIRDLKRTLIEEPTVRVEFSESCLNFYVIYFCNVRQRRTIGSQITEKILDKIKKAKKVKIAYPHLEVVGVKKR